MAGRRFRFPLDPVLQIRSGAVETAREAFGQAVRFRQSREQAADQAAADLAEALATMPTRGVRVHAIGGTAAHRESVAVAHRQAVAALDKSMASERTARQNLADAMRQLDALQSLRDEAAAEHRLAIDRADMATLDDIATSRRGRVAA